jgi:nitroreductase
METLGITLEQVILQRRAVRGFLPDKPVPPSVIREGLQLAQHAPSNCNVQPWRVYLTSGNRCALLREQLLAAYDSGDLGKAEDPIDTFPGEYRTLQVACAVELYQHMGVERHDMEGRKRAARRNFSFFDAPHVAIVAMDKHFQRGVALDVGMYVQTLMLAWWARGIASCPQAALRSYPHIIKPCLGIPDHHRILCGIAFGYEDPNEPANRTRQPRQPIENNVVFLDE